MRKTISGPKSHVLKTQHQTQSESSASRADIFSKYLGWFSRSRSARRAGSRSLGQLSSEPHSVLSTLFGQLTPAPAHAAHRRARPDLAHNHPAGLFQIESLEDRVLLTSFDFQQEIYAISQFPDSERLGASAAIDGDYAVVGATGAQVQNGSGTITSGTAYIYKRNDFGTPADTSDDFWQYQTQLIANDFTDLSGDSFGFSVDISGDTVVVGVPFDDTNGSAAGAAYIFQRDQGGVDNWGQVTKLVDAFGGNSDQFGIDVAIDNDTVVVGSTDDDDAASNAGSAFIFERDLGGADTWGERTAITASDAAADDRFATSVDISGDTIIVGSPDNDDDGSRSGSAYVFERDEGGADNWGETTKLVSSTPGSNDRFGQDVSIDGDTVVVGEWFGGPGGNGSAEVFGRNQGGGGNWGSIIELVQPASTGEFGRKVTISGTRIVVGAPADDSAGSNFGAAYIFEKDAGGTDNWGQIQQLTAVDGATDDSFGVAVALNGTTVFVGATGDDDGVGNDSGFDSGSVYVYDEDQGGTDNWGQQQKIPPSSPIAGDLTGQSVSVDGDTMVVGSPNRLAQGNSDAGAAYVYARDDAGTPSDFSDDFWVYQRTLFASDADNDDAFGTSVFISGDTIVVGAPDNDDAGSQSGSAYVFDRNLTGSNNWGERKKLVASDAAAGDLFGTSVSISGDTIVVGASAGDGTVADSGSAYIFDRNNGGANNWGQVTEVSDSTGVAGDEFGAAVGISGDTVVVTSPNDDDTAADAGSAFVFDRDQGGSDNWGQVKQLTASDGAGNDFFGESASIDGGTIVVGAPSDVATHNNEGSAYIFDRDNGGSNNWGQAQKIVASDAAADNNFGHSVSISGDRVLVGALNGDNGTSDIGAAYLFDRNRGGIDNWGQADKTNAPDPVAGDEFANVAFDGRVAVIGAPDHDDGGADAGAAYVFDVLPEVDVSVSPASVAENGVPNLVYTFTRTGGTDMSLVADFTVGGTATDGLDYVATGATTFGGGVGTVTFGVGVASVQVTVDPTDDPTVESTETVILTPTAGSGYVVSGGSASGDITSEDLVGVALSPTAVNEDGGTNLVYTFERTNTTGAVVFSFDVGGSATLNTDYTVTSSAAAFTFGASSGTITLPDGVASETITIDPTADSLVELDETIDITLQSTTGDAVSTVAAVTGTITNDDDVDVTVAPAAVSEDGVTDLVYTLNRANTSGELTVNLNVTGSATFNNDYTQSGADTFDGATATVIFPDTVGTVQVTVAPLADGLVEPDETVILTLAAGTGYTISIATPAVGTIENDDDVDVTVSPGEVTEDGATTLDYTFTRDDTSGTLTVNFDVGGTALFGTDYTQTGAATFTTTAGTVTFADTVAQVVVNVDPTSDTIAELDETAILTIAAGTGYTVSVPAVATGTITDNDDAEISFDNVSVNTAETNAGTTTLSFDVTLSAEVDTNVTVLSRTVDDLAMAGSDFTAINSQPVVFTGNFGGPQTVQVDVTINGDMVVELDETFFLDLFNIDSSGRDVSFASSQAQYLVNRLSALPNSGRFISNFQVDPTETHVVYRANQDSSSDTELYSVPVQGGTPVKLNDALATNGDVSSFQISPDGTRVVYRADQDTDGDIELYSVPIGGGTVVKLNDTLVINGDVDSFQISPDGTRVLYRADQDTDNITELYSVPIGGGTATKLNGAMQPNGDVSSNTLIFSPDNTRVLYRADQITDSRNDLFSVPVAGGTAVMLNQTLVSFSNEIFSVFISPDSSTVIYTGDIETNNETELFSVPITGGTPTKLNNPLPSGGDVDSIHITADSSTVVFRASTASQFTRELFSVPIGGGTPTTLNDPLVVNGSVGSFQITDDDTTIVYRADQDTDAVDELYSVPVAGGPATKLNGALGANGDVGFSFFLSPDQSTVVYLADQDTDNVTELFSVPIGGGTPTKLNGAMQPNGDVTSSNLTITPDSSRVIYLADQITDSFNEIFSVPIGGGTATKLNSTFTNVGQTSVFPFFDISPDGTTVVYSAPQETAFVNEIYSVPVTGGTAVKLNQALDTDEDVDSFTFTPDSSTVIFRADPNSSSRNELFAVPIGGGTIQTVSNPGAFDSVFNERYLSNGAVVFQQFVSPATDLFISDLGIQATGTINNDDTATVTLSNPVVSEALGVMTFTATLTGDVDTPFNVAFQTVDGTANAGSDYTGLNVAGGTFPDNLFFNGNNGDTATQNVTIATDNVVELNETFMLDLTTVNADGRTGINLVDGTGTILNDDSATLVVTGDTINEGHIGTSTLDFEVKLLGIIQGGLGVPFMTDDRTATTGDNDYVAKSGTLNFAATNFIETQNVSVDVNGDRKLEADEFFTLEFGPLTAPQADPNAIIVIINDTSYGWIDNDDAVEQIGVYNDGLFYLDTVVNGDWDKVAGGDTIRQFNIGGDITVPVPIVGDWDGDSDDDLGLYNNGLFYLDTTGDGAWSTVAGGDTIFDFNIGGDRSLPKPIVGDWDGDGDDDIGLYNNGLFYLDTTGNGVWNTVAGGDTIFDFNIGGDRTLPQPIIGDWDGDDDDDIGLYNNGLFYLDTISNGVWDKVAGGDAIFNYGIAALNSTATPIIGDFDGNGIDNLGLFNDSYFYLDTTGNGTWNTIFAGDTLNDFHVGGDRTAFMPIAGYWPTTVAPLSAGLASQSLTVPPPEPVPLGLDSFSAHSWANSDSHLPEKIDRAEEYLGKWTSHWHNKWDAHWPVEHGEELRDKVSTVVDTVASHVGDYLTKVESHVAQKHPEKLPYVDQVRTVVETVVHKIQDHLNPSTPPADDAPPTDGDTPTTEQLTVDSQQSAVKPSPVAEPVTITQTVSSPPEALSATPAPIVTTTVTTDEAVANIRGSNDRPPIVNRISEALYHVADRVETKLSYVHDQIADRYANVWETHQAYWLSHVREKRDDWYNRKTDVPEKLHSVIDSIEEHVDDFLDAKRSDAEEAIDAVMEKWHGFDWWAEEREKEKFEFLSSIV